MLSAQEIKTLIDNDSASARKQFARTGVRYYEAEHDIKNYRIFFVNAEGELQEDKFRSNFRISHPFFTEIVDQLVQFLMSGKDGFVFSDIPELQKELDYYFNKNEDFLAEFEETVTGAVVKGSDTMYAYKNTEGKTAFQWADGLGVVEVRAKETDDGCDYVIFWYVDRIGKDNKKITRIQVWDEQSVAFFVQDGDGNIVPDEEKKLNPRPHILYTKTGDKSTYYDGFGFIPFFRLDNNRKQISGLKPIKYIIDDYDLMNAGLTNNIQDTNEALYVVHGFQGDNLDELMLNIKNKKHIGVDEDGGVDIKTVDIPHEARKVKMEIDRDNIYRFGMAVNTEGLRDSSATVSIQIKSAYTLLEMKANKLETQIRKFMRKLLEVVLKEINDLNGTDYKQQDVRIEFEREIPTNAQEHAQIELTDAQRKQTEITTLLNLASHLDQETVLKKICEQLDVDYNQIKDKLPNPEDDDPYAAQKTLNAVVPEDGDVIEEA
jgi:SPP1 family phage portal protein